MHIGQAVKLLRTYKAVTQKQLAKQMNVKQQMISYWEKQQHINRNTLVQLLKALNSSIDEWNTLQKLISQTKNE